MHKGSLVRDNQTNKLYVVTEVSEHEYTTFVYAENNGDCRMFLLNEITLVIE